MAGDGNHGWGGEGSWWGVQPAAGDDPVLILGTHAGDVTQAVYNPPSYWEEHPPPVNTVEPMADPSGGALAVPEANERSKSQDLGDIVFAPLPIRSDLSRRVREVVKEVTKPYVHQKTAKRINQGRNLVHITNSRQVRVARDDYSNPIQAAWAVDVAAKLIRHHGFHHDGRTLNVAIVCLYDATLPDVRQGIEAIEDDDVRRLISVKTVRQLDNRGGTADFVIAVTAKCGGPTKAMNDAGSLNALLASAAVAQIIIMDITVLLERKKDAPKEIVCKPYNKNLHAIWQELGVVNVRAKPFYEHNSAQKPTPSPTPAHEHDPNHDEGDNEELASVSVPVPVPGPAFISEPAFVSHPTVIIKNASVTGLSHEASAFEPSIAYSTFEPSVAYSTFEPSIAYSNYMMDTSDKMDTSDMMDTSDEYMVECWISSSTASSDMEYPAHPAPAQQHQYTSVGTQTDSILGNPVGSRPMCFNCLFPGHDAFACPRDVSCLRCGSDHHKTRRCPVSPTAICKRCTVAGHDAPEDDWSLCELAVLRINTPVTWHQQMLREKFTKNLENASHKFRKRIAYANRNAKDGLDKPSLGSASMSMSESERGKEDEVATIKASSELGEVTEVEEMAEDRLV
jgi:hypothetical protein